MKNLTNIATLLTLLLSGCSYYEEKARPQLQGGSLFEQIEHRIIYPKCVSCHTGGSAAAGVDLSSHKNILASGSVKPGLPEQSSFYLTVHKGSMPKGGVRLENTEVQMIEVWIRNGANEKDIGTSPPTKAPPPPSNPVPSATFTYINTYILQPKCLSCHTTRNGQNPSRGIDLTSYATMVNSGALNLYYLQQSPLLTSVVNKTMPPSYATYSLSSSEISLIQMWIAQGAQQ